MSYPAQKDPYKAALRELLLTPMRESRRMLFAVMELLQERGCSPDVAATVAIETIKEHNLNARCADRLKAGRPREKGTKEGGIQ